jgi:hypothetical protein
VGRRAEDPVGGHPTAGDLREDRLVVDLAVGLPTAGTRRVVVVRQVGVRSLVVVTHRAGVTRRVAVDRQGDFRPRVARQVATRLTMGGDRAAFLSQVLDHGVLEVVSRQDDRR